MACAATLKPTLCAEDSCASSRMLLLGGASVAVVSVAPVCNGAEVLVADGDVDV